MKENSEQKQKQSKSKAKAKQKQSKSKAIGSKAQSKQYVSVESCICANHIDFGTFYTLHLFSSHEPRGLCKRAIIERRQCFFIFYVNMFYVFTFFP